MIALTRIRTETAIKSKYRGTEKASKDVELMLARRDQLNGVIPKIEFDSSFWTLAKKQLKKESKGKCAYCDANAEVVAHGDVEHYRPKSIYWWLAYTYDNYLYACQICNQTFKSDNFPAAPNLFPGPVVVGGSTDIQIQQLAGNISPDPIDILQHYTLQQFIDQHTAEDAHLINPYFDDPTTYFAYKSDDVTEEVKIIPALPQFEKNVKAAEDFYGINRPELKSIRYSVFSKFRAFKMAFTALPVGPVKSEVKKQIKDMLSDKYLFAGMNKYFDSQL